MEHRIDDDLAGQRAVLDRGDAVGRAGHAADGVDRAFVSSWSRSTFRSTIFMSSDGRAAGAEHEAAVGDVGVEVELVLRRRGDAGEDVDDAPWRAVADASGDQRADRGHQREIGELLGERLVLRVDHPQWHAVGVRRRLGLRRSDASRASSMSVPTTLDARHAEQTARMTCIWPIGPPAPTTSTRVVLADLAGGRDVLVGLGGVVAGRADPARHAVVDAADADGHGLGRSSGRRARR